MSIFSKLGNLVVSTFTNLLFHIIFSTKLRKPTIRTDWKDELYGYIGGVVRAQKGILLKIGGVDDHVHLLAKFSPAIALSEILRMIKTNSSKWVNKQALVGRKFEWQPGYAAFSVSESNVSCVSDYIVNQAEHHRKTTFEEEFLEVLKKHSIEFDRRYVFEQEIIS